MCQTYFITALKAIMEVAEVSDDATSQQDIHADPDAIQFCKSFMLLLDEMVSYVQSRLSCLRQCPSRNAGSSL